MTPLRKMTLMKIHLKTTALLPEKKKSRLNSNMHEGNNEENSAKETRKEVGKREKVSFQLSNPLKVVMKNLTFVKKQEGKRHQTTNVTQMSLR